MGYLDTAKEYFLNELDLICKDTGLSIEQAFSRWVCKKIIRMDDGDQINAVMIGGKNDYGVDIFHIEDTGDEDSYVCWAQVKFSHNLDREVTRGDIESFGHTVSYLDSPPYEANTIFKQKANEFKKIGGSESRFKKKMIFAVTGTLNKQAQELCQNVFWKDKTLKNAYSQPIDFEIYDLEKILSIIVTPTTLDIQITFNGGCLERCDTSNKKSIMGYVDADSLVNIVRKHEKTLFLENPRESLRNTPTNRKILETLEDENMKKKFWKLNNGITATCDEFAEQVSNTFNIKDLKIVNGRQTTYTLDKFTGSLDGVFVFMTIHEAVGTEERTMISETTNTQNAIKPVDLITNSPEINNLSLQCKRDYPKFYFERQTKGFLAANSDIKNVVTDRRYMEKNSTARAYYAYAIDPNVALKPDKDFFSSDQKYYNNVFQDRNIHDLIIPHIFITLMNELVKKWKSNTNKQYDGEVLHKTIVKYYVLRLIHESLFDLEESTQKEIENSLIKSFANLNKNTESPPILLDVIKYSYIYFIRTFDNLKHDTWPEVELNSKPRKSQLNPHDVMYQLKKHGQRILPVLLLDQRRARELGDDPIQNTLLKLKKDV